MHLRGGGRRIVRELSGFGLVGGCCFVLDLVLFQLLYARLGVDAVAAKALTTLTTTTVAFAGHRLITYRGRSRARPGRGYLLFAAVNGATLLLGLAIIGFVRHGLGQEDALVLQAANLASIAAGTAVRFVVYRRWVFPETVPG
ncbi:Putative flippase GtrA (transmembrane translocase of bactoprenol-linked glucose) [Trujillonella endophytica]|uniref:Putative flippase GtrA (Transmembrane translocase of bactoprenol-linked glucose) n=1 Tax=Trujillonella endophytica TaxID=673521 RepID=A0A1H8P7H0_9ACTN|nr:Putative flippase GtrA (transmembrane translocase of bactoprenol-linked glucose) [Trujillella endophytica]